MTTNREWLYSLDVADLADWFDSEHESTLDGIAAALEAEYGKGGMVGGSFCDTPEQGEVVMPLESWREYLGAESENADSRELILTDLEKKTREWHDYDGNFMRIYSDVAYAQVKELLDRQAAITSHQWELYHNDMMREWMAKTVELQEQVDELQAITDERWNKYIAEHLRADTLADDLLTANRQREQYRKLFGMALDWAHEITMLESSVDEGVA